MKDVLVINSGLFTGAEKCDIGDTIRVDALSECGKLDGVLHQHGYRGDVHDQLVAGMGNHQRGLETIRHEDDDDENAEDVVSQEAQEEDQNRINGFQKTNLASVGHATVALKCHLDDIRIGRVLLSNVFLASVHQLRVVEGKGHGVFWSRRFRGYGWGE